MRNRHLELTPQRVAAIDQLEAEVGTVAELVRLHRAHCPVPDGRCPGAAASSAVVAAGQRVCVHDLAITAVRRWVDTADRVTRLEAANAMLVSSGDVMTAELTRASVEIDGLRNAVALYESSAKLRDAGDPWHIVYTQAAKQAAAVLGIGL